MKLAVFDLDGTLLDTLPDICDNINAMLSRFGYRTLPIEELKKLVGNGARNLVSNSIGSPIEEDLLKERLDYYNELYNNSTSPKTRLFVGIGEVLEELKNRNYKIAILTNKPQSSLDPVYEIYLKKFRFDKVVGNGEGKKLKPNPEELLKIMKSFNATPSETYFIGDGEADVKLSLNAKVNGIACLWGYRDKETLKSVGATTFAENPVDLIKILL